MIGFPPALSFREINYRIFRGEPAAFPLFQPRAEPWFAWKRLHSEIPELMECRDVFSFYDSLGLSMRYYHYYTGIADPIAEEPGAEVKMREEITSAGRSPRDH